MRTFTDGGQVFEFVETSRKGGRRYDRFLGECAICRNEIMVEVPAGADARLGIKRRCSYHKVQGAAVGSKAEAIAIATHNWRVASGSAVDLMRRNGRAWKATVTVEPPDGVAPPRGTRDRTVRDLPLREVSMARRVRTLGPLTAPRAAQMTGMTDATARVYAARLVERGLFKRVSRGVFDLTEEGQRFFAPDPNPGPLVPMDLSCLDDEPVMGLFD